MIPNTDARFYYCSICGNDSGDPKFSKQVVGSNKLAKIISGMCKVAGIPSRKTGHSGKETCATTLYQQNFSDQIIKEHKYKRTETDQKMNVSMALLLKKA